jgi:uncharacterized membrane protein
MAEQGMADVSLLRTLHVAGAVMLLGNVTVTGFWATYLYRDRRRVPFPAVARAILWTDLVFTLGGGVLLTVSGILLAMRHGYRVAETPWLLEGIVALAVATLLWLFVLLPDQWRMEHLAPGDDPALRRLFLRWSVVGWGATLVLFYGLYVMVGKS